MKILLNGLSLAYPISGVGQYTLQLGRSLKALLGNGNIFWFGNNELGYGQEYSEPIGLNIIDRVQCQYKKGLRKVPGLKNLGHLWRDHQFRSYVRKVTPSLYHETNYAPFHFDHGPTIVTLCDLSFVRHPEWHPKDRVKHLENFCLKKISQVKAIITISEFSRKEILNLLNIDPIQIHVTPLGIDQSFHPAGNRLEGLPNQYILFLGNLEPRKNLPRLMKAYQSLPQTLKRRYPLVIAGASGWHTHELKQVLRLFQRGERPILTGYVSQGFLPDLYRGASLFVYPSLYEGFGLPVLEAMASGVPVITSNSTSLPEVVGDGGLLVNPYDVDLLREAMRELLEDEKKRREMIERSLVRAKLFSWDKCARQTLAVYEKVLGKLG
ncbi:MAG: glycosyltransferase family 4 protein [Syntrophaceae bacterium]|nr:glycosyltransferase family 4 protein [Syntrophaceae bacterium]